VTYKGIDVIGVVSKVSREISGFIFGHSGQSCSLPLYSPLPRTHERGMEGEFYERLAWDSSKRRRFCPYLRFQALQRFARKSDKNPRNDRGSIESSSESSGSGSRHFPNPASDAGIAKMQSFRLARWRSSVIPSWRLDRCITEIPHGYVMAYEPSSGHR
jgi:hypothetical protein